MSVKWTGQYGLVMVDRQRQEGIEKVEISPKFRQIDQLTIRAEAN